MTSIRIDSVQEPFTAPEASKAASTLLGRAESMGLLEQLGPISSLDPDLIKTVLRRLAQAGVAQNVLMYGGARQLPADPAQMLRLLEMANTALEDSPLPEQEWAALRHALGDALLARLCRISEASLRRYSAGSRPTPDRVAQRLHALALVVADLRGAYNDYGIRRWFQRPRTQLKGKSPETFLPATWTLDSPELDEVRRLAAALTASPIT
jgi:hypothetical protein